MRTDAPVRPAGNDRVVSVRLKPAHKRWLARIAERDRLSEGRVALRELERFITAEAQRLLERDHAAELEALGATSQTPSPETEAAP